MSALTDAATNRRGIGGIPRIDIAKRVSKSKEALLCLMRYLGHPHVSSYERENCEALERQLMLAAQLYVDTWPENTKPHVIDVVGMAAIKSDLSPSLVHQIFGGTSLEIELTPPTEAALKRDGFQVKREVSVGGSRADLVGYESGFFGRKIIIIELKNTPEQCDRLAAQVEDYRRACDVVRVVMTPECLAKVTLAHGDLTRPLAYEEIVSKLGAELWTYDTTREKFEKVASGSFVHDKNAYDNLWAELTKE